MSLRKETIPDDGCLSRSQEDFSITSGNVQVLFQDHAQHLVKLIGEYEFAYGCVAWLTDFEILKALSKVSTQIIVQKEDFLRPDLDTRWNKQKLRQAYNNVRCREERYDIDGLVADLSVCGDPSMSGIRCMGQCSSQGKKVSPRMHHKFLVLGRRENSQRGDLCKRPVPEIVWTGSFNFTWNAGMSIENAVIIRDEKIARAYFNEWQQIFALSEPLDWNEEYVAPEYRIGT